MGTVRGRSIATRGLALAAALMRADKRHLMFIPIALALVAAIAWPVYDGQLASLPPAKHPDDPDAAAAWRTLSYLDENGQMPDNALLRAKAHVDRMPHVSAGSATTAAKEANGPVAGNGAGIGRETWTWLGPGNVGGRIRAILVHPTSTNTMWVGSATGGIWKTTNGGGTWSPVDDFMGSLSVSALVMDSSNTQVMYAGTGEGWVGSRYHVDPATTPAFRGAGVFKSTDGGGSWSQLPTTSGADWYFVHELAISPSNSQVLLAATGSGLYRTTNGGTSWTQVLSGTVTDAHFDPTDGTKAVAASFWGRTWYSSNSGAGWTSATGIPVTATWTDRVELAYAPNAPSTVYAGVNQSNGQVWRSTDGGQTYTLRSTGSNYFLGSGNQGSYDNTIWVSPTNANVVAVGGIDLWRSTDGAATFTQISNWADSRDYGSAHADNHIIVSHPGYNGTSNRTVYFGNDGGIYATADLLAVAPRSGWQQLNNNLGITQFYGAAGSTGTGRIVGGTQDNGTLGYSGTVNGWSLGPVTWGGDGGYAAADGTYLYGEYVYLDLHRSSDSGATASYISGMYWNGTDYVWKSPPYVIPDARDSKANFIAPFVLDPNDSNRILAGGNSLWRTNDAKTANTNSTGPSWAPIKAPIVVNQAEIPISAIAIQAGNPDVVWVGHNSGHFYRTTNGTSASPTWTRRDAAEQPGRIVLRITISPHDPNVVYVAFGGFTPGNLWRTTDGGDTWTDVTGSGAAKLPSVPIRDVEVHPGNANWLYAATEIGVFTSSDAGATWQVPSDGPANVPVDELFWMSGNLVAATHGRGLFRTPIGTSVICPPDDGYEPNNTRGTATALNSGVSLAGIACNDDWFSISAGAGQTLTVDLTFTHAQGDLDMRLFDSGGAQLAISQSTTDNERIEYPVTQVGEYFVRVYGYQGATNVYTIRATAAGVADNTPPSVSRPGYRFRTDSRLQAVNLPVRINWTGSDPGGSGVAEYRLQHRTDRGAWSGIGLGGSLSNNKVVNLAPGHDHQFRVRARDAAGNWSTWSTGRNFALGVVQENGGAISYNAGWRRVALSGAYGGYVKYATVATARATFSFTGRKVAWVSTQAPARGTADIFVDGVKVATIDLYRASRRTRVVVWSQSWGTTASHQISVRLLGTAGRPRIDIDAFGWAD